MKIFSHYLLFSLLVSLQPAIGYAADQSSGQSSVPAGDATATIQSPERNLLKTGGAINKQLGGALSEYGQQRGGLIGMGARVSGSIYTATGGAIEDVADNKKSVGQAHSDTIKAAVSAHKAELNSAPAQTKAMPLRSKKEFSGTASTTPAVVPKNQKANNPPPVVSSARSSGGEKVQTPIALPVTSPSPEPSEEERYVALLQSPDDETRRSALKEIHAGQLIYNKTVLDTAERILLEQHRENKGAVFSDSMSWICRVLGDSGERRYLDTLQKVATNGSTWKLRMHATNSRDKLTAGIPAHDDNSGGGVEERLQKLSKLQQSGLITQEEYNSKRKELIKQL